VGENVRIQGAVTRFHVFDGGSVIIELSDETGSADVYLQKNVAQEYNTKNYSSLEVTGSIKYYKGGREVYVDDPTNIKVIS